MMKIDRCNGMANGCWFFLFLPHPPFLCVWFFLFFSIKFFCSSVVGFPTTTKNTIVLSFPSRFFTAKAVSFSFCLDFYSRWSLLYLMEIKGSRTLSYNTQRQKKMSTTEQLFKQPTFYCSMYYSEPRSQFPTPTQTSMAITLFVCLFMISSL